MLVDGREVELDLLLVPVLHVVSLLFLHAHLDLHLLDHLVQLLHLPLQGLDQAVLLFTVFVWVLNYFMLDNRLSNFGFLVQLLDLDFIVVSLRLLELLVLSV